MDKSVGAAVEAPDSWETADVDKQLELLTLNSKEKSKAKHPLKADHGHRTVEFDPPCNPSPPDTSKKDLSIITADLDEMLIDALRNPRERITILRMEQDLDKFIKSRDLVFEFPRMQSTFQRAIAYKVAQYYSLETSARDTCIVIARKKLGSKLPAVKLVDIVATFKGESSESENSFTIKPRSNPQRSQSSEFGRMLITQIGPKSVEEREEGYKKARARIFNENSKDSSNEAKVALEEPSKKKTELSPREEIKINSSNSPDNGEVAKKVTKVESSRNKAIIRDPEKERSDPDFARNRGRYVPGYDPVFRPPNPQFYYPNPYALAGHYNAEFPSLNHNQNPQVSQSNQPPIYGGDSVPQSWIHPHYSGAPYWPGASAAPYYQGHGYPHSSQAGVYLPSRGPSASLQSPNSNSVDHSQSSQVEFPQPSVRRS